MDGQTPTKDTTEKRGKPWEPHEVQALCSFVKMNASTLFGTGGRGSMGVERQKVEAWDRCRLAIVSAGGRSDRSLEKIRKKWQDLSSKAKKYNVQRRKEMHGTGGGAFTPPNEQYELVLQALPNELRDGITAIGNSESIPSIGQLPLIDATGKTSRPTSSSVFVEREKIPSIGQLPLIDATGKTSRPTSSSVFVEREKIPSIGQLPLIDATGKTSRPTSSSVFVEREKIPSVGQIPLIDATGKTSRPTSSCVCVEREKRPAPITESETEDSQERRQAMKKRKKGKKLKKDSDEIDLLTLNKTMVLKEERKVVALEGILSTLKGIHGLLERISSNFNQSGPEQ
ncbi:uncharacterized protein LOC121424102 [Lytechinus variegatus]|uniref:uncharacterized protein LOC121424102 n=1 Tax=Lytechinus variegatus TaxID=7654 RepID=UPI001BB12270|nr:uncharacterized protein LOC121424102 [Lytechinus variegatus]